MFSCQPFCRWTVTAKVAKQQKSPISILWFKRDLRLRDHAALAAAIRADYPVLFCYFYEPTLLASAESDLRHERFVAQSLQDLNRQLAVYNARIHIFHQEVLPAFAKLNQHFQIKNIFSHQETGLKCTFDRDRAVRQFCRENGIHWQEFAQDGIRRGASNRVGWQKGVQEAWASAVVEPDLSALRSVVLPESLRLSLAGQPLPDQFYTPDENFQPGGETYAWRYLQGFVTQRARNYSRHLSKPALSRKSCSRLSPYIAWGNLSVRQIMQLSERHKKHPALDFHLRNFQSRLWWRSHYIQKLESMWQLEFEAINPALRDIDRTLDERFDAWAQGRTGFPMVDASMRCLRATGWINFRMRAMLATFVTFTLWQDWRAAASHLAQLFTDFEPGIHFAQFQMQAGLTGYHPMRIFNPIIQAEQHDGEGDFARRWIPELEQVPAPQIYRPWQMTKMEQIFYNCRVGEDYPTPVVDYDQATQVARERYWRFRQRPEVQAALPAIWERLCIPKDIRRYREQGYNFAAGEENRL